MIGGAKGHGCALFLRCRTQRKRQRAGNIVETVIEKSGLWRSDAAVFPREMLERAHIESDATGLLQPITLRCASVACKSLSCRHERAMKITSEAMSRRGVAEYLPEMTSEAARPLLADEDIQPRWCTNPLRDRSACLSTETVYGLAGRGHRIVNSR